MADMILSSEVGVLPVPEEKIVLKERLHPGKMLLVDTVQGKIIDDNELKEMYAKKQPYGEWLDSNLVHLKDIEDSKRKNGRIYRGTAFPVFRRLSDTLMSSIVLLSETWR